MLACPEVARVVVVTSDPVAGPLLAALGAVVVPTSQAGLDGRGPRPWRRSPTTRDPGPAERGAAARRRGGGPALAGVPASRRYRRPARGEPGRAGRGAARRGPAAPGPAAFVPDAAGVGTTLYAVPPGGEFRPLFGGASRARHAAAGAAELDLDD